MVINIMALFLSISHFKLEYFEFKSIAFPFLSMFVHFCALFCFRHICLIRKCFQKVLKISLLQITDSARVKVYFFLAMNVTNVLQLKAHRNKNLTF